MNKSYPLNVSAVVLAAGASRRMGQAKMLLPWGKETVIRKVVTTLLNGGVVDPVVVTGRMAKEVVENLYDLPVRFVLNNDYENTEMFDSLQIGLKSLAMDVPACLIALGDQPQIEIDTVKTIIEEYLKHTYPIIIPSFQLKRGHPWLLTRETWIELLDFPRKSTLRNFLNLHAEKIHYTNLETPSILQDLDTPEDYERGKP